MNTANELLDLLKQVQSISDIGLLYAKDPYDKERYEALKQLGQHMLQLLSGHDATALQLQYPHVKDYPTAKVDVRGLLLDEQGRLLLVKEQADGRWSLPGGWADVGQTPAEVVIKEFVEETGLVVTAERLLAVFDKRMHPHPPQPFYVYKFVFLCKAASQQLNKGFDVLDVQFFEPDQLPALSEDRILASQIQLLLQRVEAGESEAYFD
ncbi:NUDIX hydrolase [Deminuibacter soli]|uniref:NUDIX domain-containing protein n=1 Tax=Deminuibacter soli TaxID=2291815 RepID=A0A3E1NJ31_9BACT|nr:NUDIX hydrolase [Deminuibacter soli]RFM27891.1 NUDIX domain-containing protein [Deminuibacter soli]